MEYGIWNAWNMLCNVYNKCIHRICIYIIYVNIYIYIYIYIYACIICVNKRNSFTVAKHSSDAVNNLPAFMV